MKLFLRFWKPNGFSILLLKLPSGLTSPRRTTLCARSRSAKPKNLDRLILPVGSNRTRRRAGAIGERGSIVIVTLRSEAGRRNSRLVWIAREVVFKHRRGKFRSLTKR